MPNPLRDVLILVDLQNDFLPGGALAVREGDQVMPVANRMAARFDWVVATQDWHPPDHTSFAANNPGRAVGEVIDLDGIPQVLWPVHCVQNTRGAELAPDLDRSRIQEVFRKGTDRGIDSYSAFYDNGHRRSTGLGERLRAQGFERVHLLGLATDYCVKFSALDARMLGFETILVVDGCRGVELNDGDIRRSIDEMTAAGVRIVESAGIERSRSA